ncbi:hypothetical protein J6590_003856 [Homalodisca vitripennis]|nr:hypothetical protein J6590_003856 [Homalodisca vitripennis]
MAVGKKGGSRKQDGNVYTETVTTADVLLAAAGLPGSHKMKRWREDVCPHKCPAVAGLTCDIYPRGRLDPSTFCACAVSCSSSSSSLRMRIAHGARLARYGSCVSLIIVSGLVIAAPTAGFRIGGADTIVLDSCPGRYVAQPIPGIVSPYIMPLGDLGISGPRRYVLLFPRNAKR